MHVRHRGWRRRFLCRGVAEEIATLENEPVCGLAGEGTDLDRVVRHRGSSQRRAGRGTRATLLPKRVPDGDCKVVGGDYLKRGLVKPE
ncbi:hypothetical protein [Methanopyrus sp.]